MDKDNVYEHDDAVVKSAQSLEAAQDEQPGLTPEELEAEKKLVRKIDLYILPSMWIMYLLSYMDRTK
jgi:hypothetical protein